jgi:cell division protein FtsB
LTDWLRFRRREGRDPADREFTDARVVDRAGRRRELDPEERRRLTLRRRALVLGLSAVCLSGTLAAVVGKGGYLDMLRLRSEIASLEADIQGREAAVRQLEREVRHLEGDPMARERLAREQLGLIRPGEIDFLLPREERPAWDAPTGTTPRQP